MLIVVLAELNVAVSVLKVPDVAPGMIPPNQFDVVCQAPVVAVELHVPLAANNVETTPIDVNQMASERWSRRARIPCRSVPARVSEEK
jgi:hypothetical protein